jgi:hypothetical protein
MTGSVFAAESDAVRLELNEKTTTGADAVWKLDQYALETQPLVKDKPRISLKNIVDQRFINKAAGTATTTFTGNDGWYTLVAEHWDHANGRSTLELKVDGKRLALWYGDGLWGDNVVRKQIPHVQLKKGSRIDWAGSTAGSDMVALIALEIAPGEPPPPPPKINLAANKYSMNLAPVAQYHATTDPKLMIPTPVSTWQEYGVEPDVTKAPAFLFAAKKGERFDVKVYNSDKLATDIPWTIRKYTEGSAAVAGGTVNVPRGTNSLVAFDVPEDAVYELKISGTITNGSHGLTRPLTLGVNNVFIYVPKGTTGIRVSAPVKAKNPTPFLLRDSAGTIFYQGEITPKTKLDIPAPADKTGQVWYFESSTRSGMLIEGVPQYGALQAHDLLAPVETLPAEKLAATPTLPDPAKPIAASAMMAGATPVTLVKNGVAHCVIVAKSRTDEVVDLQQILMDVTGAVIPITDQMPEKGAAIVVAADGEYPNLPAPKGFKELSDQGIGLYTEGERLYILARKPRGLPPAVYSFLRQIGCRWYFGDRQWDLLPTSRDLTVALNLVSQPDFISRRISNGPSARGVREMGVWARRNRLGSGINGNIHHSYAQFVPEELHKEHPEYFSMKDTNGDGKGDTRVAGQPCTTHPEVVKMFLAKAVEKVAKEPDLDLLCVSPNDGTVNMCRCDRCQALGSYTDCAWTLAHQVADELRKNFPGRKVWVGFYAYGEVSRPPTIKVEADPDIVVQIATAYNKTSVAKMFEEWPKYVGMIGVREYFAIPQWGANNPGKGITPVKARTILPVYLSNKATMMNAESCPAWGGAGVGMYLAAQLMWDGKQDADKLLEEFYTECFGAAAPAMKRYFERWNRERFEPRTNKLAMIDLREAMLKADTVGARRRVSLFVLYIHHHHLMAAWQAGVGTLQGEDREEFTGDGGLFRYKTRDFGMLRTKSAGETESVNGVPYYTYDEVMALVDKELVTLKDVEIAELQTMFNSNLGPVSAQAVGTVRPAEPLLPQENATLVMNLEKGKSVTMEIHGKEKPVKLRFASPRPSTPVEEKEWVTANDVEKVTFTATDSGLHRLIVDSDNIKYRLIEPENWAAQIKNEKNTNWLLVSAGASQTYSFYVPIGAEAIYFGFLGKAAPGSFVELIDNQGKVVVRVDRGEDGRINRPSTMIHVEPGKDNQVWTVRTSPGVASRSKIMLRGIPPYVNSDPTKLLIPLGQSDGVADEE